MAVDQPLRAGAKKRANVDPVVLVEAAVLVGDEHRDIARIDVVRTRRQAPAAIGQGKGPEQAAVAVDDDGRALARGVKIERAEARRVAAPGEGRAKACRRHERKRRSEYEGETARKAHYATPSSGPSGHLLPPRECGPKGRLRLTSPSP